MRQMVDKLASLEGNISSEKGEFSLFALLPREDAPDKWDLVASAPWLIENKKKSLDYFVGQLQSRLDSDELLSLSRIVLLEQDNPVLKSIQRAVRVRHGMVEVKGTIFFGLPVKHAYIITSEGESYAANTVFRTEG